MTSKAKKIIKDRKKEIRYLIKYLEELIGKNWIAKILPTTIIVTLLASAMYYFGYIYQEKFFSVLSIEHTVINWPFPLFVIRGFPWVVLVILILVMFVTLPINYAKLKKRHKWPIMVIVVMSIIIYLLWGYGFALWYFVFALVFFILAVYNSTFTQRIMHIFPFGLIGILTVVSIIALVVRLIGENRANILLHEETKMVVFTFDTSRTELSELNDTMDQEFVLIMYYGNKYYVIENSQPLPKNPDLIIIHDREVIRAVVHRKN